MNDDSESLETILVFTGFAIFVGFMFTAIKVYGHISSYVKLKFCYIVNHCVPVEFMYETYPAKTTSEPDYYIINKFNGPVAILNIKSKIVHYDLECKFAKLCTKNCVYMPLKKALELDAERKIYDCKYEENISKHCSNICSDVPIGTPDDCVKSCAETKYKDKYFNLHEYIEETERLEEEHSNDYEYEDRFGIIHN